MLDKVNILIEKKESGYLVSSPAIEGHQFQDDSLESVFERLKEVIKDYLETTSTSHHQTTGESLINLVADFTKDMTEEEMNQLPTDGAEQHEHYLYGTPKKAR
ncbi:type II toxin-antitoxin system HicB family antitoxin [Fischerella sp. PCC 9605]|uniref:type II toxin-antitoxin system HicB family antitoxin n=1 Tax=Fischerella sp. PCC 9605 TaxID=1173024 RepID=UPI00047AA6F7|nr:hypothetical protein [Fischerella sp. PCC 9605]